jgi:tetratricopeptide (TPR) repeat protein
MGTVWLAEQQTPLRRLVALKVVRPGLDSAAVVARFEAERQALALMNHPNIARVLDAGTIEEREEGGGRRDERKQSSACLPSSLIPHPSSLRVGRPYFAMELVVGVPITRFCQDHGLDLRDRLTLFVQVCRAVQHAHQKGIIHRDIKPSNVLVALCDDKPVPKVIDFGIAKALFDQAPDTGPVTGFGAVIGTPEYMSPEQAEPGRLDVDTRSDVYSLGVLLYEMLTSATPLGPVKLPADGKPASPGARGDEPLPPSTRAGTPSWRRQIRGDLDWIVLKALERDRERRYETADGLAQDVLRHLADEPVLARPPSRAYRLRKFVRKHRGAVLATALTLLALLGGIAGTTVGMLRAWDAEADAVTARKAESEQLRQVEIQRDLATANAEAARKAQASAREEEETTAAVLDFVLRQVFAAARPKGLENGLGPNVTVREAVNAAEPKIARAFAGRPLVEASVRTVLGGTYEYLGEAEEAVRQHTEALRLREKHLGPDHQLTVAAMSNVGNSYCSATRFNDAVGMLEAALKKCPASGARADADTLTIMNNLGRAYYRLGRPAEAIRVLEHVRAGSRSMFGPDHLRTLATMNNLSEAYRRAGRLADAITVLKETLPRCRSSLGKDHSLTLAVMNNLSDFYRSAGRFREAAPLFHSVLERAVQVFGPDHPHVLATMFNLGQTYCALGQFAEAVEWHEKALAGRKKKLPHGHYDVFRSLNGLAEAYIGAGRNVEAGRLIEERLELAKGDPRATKAWPALLTGAGRQFIQAGQFIQAERVLKEALALREKSERDDWTTSNTRALLGLALLGQQRFDEAQPLLLTGYEGMKQQEAKIPPAQRRPLADAGGRIVELYERWGRPAEADRWRKKLGLPVPQPLPPPRPVPAEGD